MIVITKLELKDFKLHENLQLSLGGLTILTGQNGMGKSSIMQSLLLLRQSYNQQEYLKGVNLKGPLTDLGYANDVECQSSKDGELVINLTIENSEENIEKDLNFSFSYSDVDTFDTFLPAKNPMPDINLVKQCSLFTNDFQYISAFRYGPQKGYERDTDVVQTHQQISKVNGQCEYVVHYLYHFSKKECMPELLFEGSEDKDLISQVQYWMQQVSPRVSINIDRNGADFKLNYKYSRDGQYMTEPMAALNVGYGVTYVLPIIVAVLSAKPGSLVLIENPEAHIHPRAQAELMKLIMKAVNAGVQIIIETHSDHIMNGALVSVAKNPNCLNLIKAYYFERKDDSHTSKPCKLEILEDGRIIDPPKGFFDQIDIDMRLLMGF